MIWLLAGIAALLTIIERCWPAHELPAVEGWWQRIALVNIVQAGIVLLAGITWDRWLSSASLFHLSERFSSLTSGLVAYFVSTFAYYWWHRLRHESEFFWKVCHQMHHSPRRIELLVSFYKHPVEILINSVLSSLLVYTLLGCSREGAMVYTFTTAVAEYFYHLNVRTPHWLGWWIQRPESHRIHHQYRHHSQNYADLPLWDLLFRTFNNPRTATEKCGFDPGREARVAEMLVFRDVHTKPPVIPPECFGCRKRWACYAQKNSGTGSDQSPS